MLVIIRGVCIISVSSTYVNELLTLVGNSRREILSTFAGESISAKTTTRSLQDSISFDLLFFLFLIIVFFFFQYL